MKIDKCPTCGGKHDSVKTYKVAGSTMAKCPNGKGLSCFCLDKYLKEVELEK